MEVAEVVILVTYLRKSTKVREVEGEDSGRSL